MALFTTVSFISFTIFKALGTLLLTDLGSGFVHWLEDSYGKADWPVLGKRVIQPNIEHHFYPRKFTKTSVWSRNTGTLGIAAILGVIVMTCGVFSVWWAIALILGGFANGHLRKHQFW